MDFKESQCNDKKQWTNKIDQISNLLWNQVGKYELPKKFTK